MTKRKIKNKKPSEKWKKYKVVGSLLQKGRFCPRCGDVFLAVHKDRVFCGQCHYSEFSRKEEPKTFKVDKKDLGLATEVDKETVEKLAKKVLEKK